MCLPTTSILVGCSLRIVSCSCFFICCSCIASFVIVTVCNKVPTISKFDIVVFFITKPKINVNVIIINDNICFIFLSFFLKIGTFCVSAGAYFFIITMLNAHIENTVIYFIKSLFHTKYWLKKAFPVYIIVVAIIHPM